MNLDKIRRTAAEIVAAAVYESFPGVELWGAAHSRAGFSYDFFFPHPIHPELHFQIEEKMRQIVREKREIRDQDMVPFSAQEFFKSQGRSKIAERIEGEGLVRVVRIGNFSDLAEGDHLNNTSELSFFKLFPAVQLEGKGMRITGAAYDSKESLKEFLKKWASYPNLRHEKIGERMGFCRFFEDEVVWLPKGVRFLEKMIRLFRENLSPGAKEIRAPRHLSRPRLLENLGGGALFEIIAVQGEAVGDSGLFEPIEGTAVELVISLEQMISSLQSIGKTLNILGFNYCLSLTGFGRKDRGVKIFTKALEELGWNFDLSPEEESDAELKFLVSDGLGNMWNAVSVAVKEFLFVRAVVERNFALLLEQQELLKNIERIDAT